MRKIEIDAIAEGQVMEFKSNGFSAINEEYYEQVLIEYLTKKLGYDHLYGPDVARSGPGKKDVFIEDLLQPSLEHINPELPHEAIEAAIDKIKTIDAGSLSQRNEVFTDYLQSGVEVRFFDGQEERNDIVKLLDYNNPDNNTFRVVNQWEIVECSSKRLDLVIFVNGMPLVIFELKSPSREETDASQAYLQLRNYMNHVPSMFVTNAFCVMSDMAETRVGTITASEDRYSSWKSVDGSYVSTKAADWRTMLDGMFPKDKLLDIVRDFVCFDVKESGSTKILARYHQYYAVKKAVDRALAAINGDGKIGVFWHTQGSGKSLSMVFFVRILQRRLPGVTFIVATDRNDLDDQLYGQFARCSSFLRQVPLHAKSRKNLKELLADRDANGIIFTTMQKFMDGGEPLCDRSDVVVVADEAHRSQYGLTERMDAEGNIHTGAAKLARMALPNASYIGFTGTPIEFDDRNTREVFGDYIDVYDMTQSVNDEATRPVYYESRVVSLHLDKSKLDQLDQAYEEFASTAPDDESVERAKRNQAGLDALFGAPETVTNLCNDIVKHYEENRADVLSGKALIVAYSRPMAMKIYYQLLKIRPDWEEKLGVVMTTGNQDPEEWFEVCGGSTHKKEMERKFKNEDDPLKIAIVVDMWLTGFDVPSLSTMYVFKPMKGYSLMQAIARVNRVCRDKEGGLIVDYIGIARSLKQAMRDYTIRDKQNYGNMNVSETALPKFHEKLDVCRDLMHGFDYQGIFSAGKIELAQLIADGTDWLLDPSRVDDMEEFLKQCLLMNQALSLCKSLVSDLEQHEAAYLSVLRVQVLRLSSDGLSSVRHESYAEFNSRVAAILEQTVHADGVVDIFEHDSIEVSIFDESFLKEIANMKQKNLALESLKRLIKEQVRNYQRTSVVQAKKFSDMLQGTLNAYLNGMLTNAQVIDELLQMARDMMKNRDEAIALGLNDDEMAFYDAISQPEAVKDFYDNDQLAAIARELTEALQKSATVDWQLKESARAGMRRAIKRLLHKYKYPPEQTPKAIDTVMAQCELWVNTQTFE